MAFAEMKTLLSGAGGKAASGLFGGPLGLALTIGSTLAFSPLGDALAEAITGEKAATRKAKQTLKERDAASRREALDYLRRREKGDREEQRATQARQEQLGLLGMVAGAAEGARNRQFAREQSADFSNVIPSTVAGAVSTPEQAMAHERLSRSIEAAKLELYRRVNEGTQVNPLLVAGINLG